MNNWKSTRDELVHTSLNSSNGMEYKPATAPFRTCPSTFDISNVNISGITLPITSINSGTTLTFSGSDQSSNISIYTKTIIVD